MENSKLNLATMAAMFADETKAREWLESKRWPNGPTCPHCACLDHYKLATAGRYKCKGCREQYTVRIGTILEESKVPISKWLMAIHLMTSSKKGVSSHQIARECGITQKSAWFLNHRIREAMKQEPMASLLEGTVEVDECYVGGKPRKGTGPHKRGMGTKKAPVIALVERDGDVRTFPLESINSGSMKKAVAENVSPDATINTDEGRWYMGIRDDDSHKTVKHRIGEYARKEADGSLTTINTAESFFALLKRGHFGIFHHLSKKHLHRYCTEFGFRWNHRKVTDGERMVALIEQVEGKRLYFREPIAKTKLSENS